MRILARAALLFSAVAALAAAPALARAPRPGALDPGFGHRGTIVRGFGTVPGEGTAEAAAPMPDGGFVVVTSSGSIGRYGPSGALDTDFGTDGYRIQAHAYGSSVATTATGLIYVLAGYSPSRLSRLLPDGAPDRSFGDDGSAELDGRFLEEPEVFVLPDGGALIAAQSLPRDFTTTVSAVRVRADGEIDRSYGDGGQVTLHLPTSGERSARFALDGESLDFVAEAKHSVESGGVFYRRLLLGRFGPEGQIDPSLSGSLVLPHGALESQLIPPVVGADGSLLIASRSGGVLRLLADGRPDPSFGSGGFSEPPGLPEADFNAIVPAPGGGAYLAGSTETLLPDEAEGGRRLDAGDFELVELGASGALEAAFGSDGVAAAHPGRPTAVRSLITLADGDLLAAGAIEQSEISAARFGPSGVLDPTFASGGLLRTAPIRYSSDAIEAAAALPDGGFVVAGHAGGKIAVARYLRGGRPDPAFGDGGAVLLDLGDDASAEVARSVQPYPGGRILIGASSKPGTASLLMLGPRGALDRRFGHGGIAAARDFAAVTDLALTPDGAILAAGYSKRPCRSLIERFGARGGRELPFGEGDGVAPIARGCKAAGARLVRRRDGGIVAAERGESVVVEMTSSGRPVAGFEYLPGLAQRDREALVEAIALDRKGRILVGGEYAERLGVVRLNRRGGLDRRFGAGGFAVREVGRRATVTELSVEPSGKILATGDAYTCPAGECEGLTAAVARFGSDGSVDREFGVGGVWTGPRERSSLSAIVPLGAGGLVAAGWVARGGDRNLFAVGLGR